MTQADQDASSPSDLAARTVAHLKAKGIPEETGVLTDDRDEVSGPLRSAHGGAGVVDIDDTYEEEIKEQEGAWTHKVRREHVEHSKVSLMSRREFSCSFAHSLRYSVPTCLIFADPGIFPGKSSVTEWLVSGTGVFLVIESQPPYWLYAY